ncbi:MAG TPA: helix-turn-helix domain-containing protein [Spirochaetota bacterium]|nr:helix-turn-helix domain-containing protein [Spirochaetota bacterium]
MVQRLKEHIRDKILNSARTLFAEKGISNVTMAQIAERSSISTGNLYHYFSDKNSLVEESIPESFGKLFIEALEDRFMALSGKFDSQHPIMHPLDDELIDLVISSRTVFIVLFYHESLHAEIREQCISRMCDLAIQRAHSFGMPMDSFTSEHMLVVTSVYRALIKQMAEILFRYSDREQISESIRLILNYHITGISTLFKSCGQNNTALKGTYPPEYGSPQN